MAFSSIFLADLYEVGVCGIAFQSSIRFGTECRTFFGTSSVRNLTNSAELFRIGSESVLVCVIRVTKHFEICVLQTARDVCLSQAFLAAFHEPPFFRNSDFFRIPEIVRYGTVRFLKLLFRTIFRSSADL